MGSILRRIVRKQKQIQKNIHERNVIWENECLPYHLRSEEYRIISNKRQEQSILDLKKTLHYITEILAK